MESQVQIYLGLGANLGDRESNLVEAMNRLRPHVEITRVSRAYETDPVGYTDQPRFLNIACAGMTELCPDDLVRQVKRIESRMGRNADGARNGPRPIDIDILFYGDTALESEHLTIPHPRLHERAFVLVPLAEIAPELRHPVLHKTVAELLAGVARDGVMPQGHGLLAAYSRDIQSEAPHVSIGLDRVGLTGLRRIIRLTSSGRPEYLPAQLQMYVDLAGDQKGAHMSRFSIAVEDAVNEVMQQTAPNIETLSLRVARELLKAQGALRAEVQVRAEFPLSRRTPVSGYRSQEIYQLIGIAAAAPSVDVQLIGVEAQGMTACPCAQELIRERSRTRLLEEGFSEQEVGRIFEAVPIPTHNQCGRGELLIGAAPTIRAEDLVHIVEAAMSSETYEVLKRPDEYFVVDRAHRNPKFVEDVVRDVLAHTAEIYEELADDTFVRARQTNLETIHKHDVFAERCALLGDIRRELAGGKTASRSISLHGWIHDRLAQGG